MNFLALVITLVLRQLWGSGSPVHQDDWFYRWQASVSAWNLGAVAQLSVTVLPPLAVAYWMLNLLQPLLFGLLWIAMAVVLLFYALGRGDFKTLMARYRSQCIAGDFEGAYLGTLPELGEGGAVDDPQSFAAVHTLAQRGFLYAGYQRWFPVLFYFALLGPVAALGYRLLHLCRDNVESAPTERLILLLDWIPARLLAVTFTLVGNFVDSRDTLFHVLGDLAAAPRQLLFDVASKATDLTSLESTPGLSSEEATAAQNQEVENLLSRSAICWVAVMSLIVVLG